MQSLERGYEIKSMGSPERAAVRRVWILLLVNVLVSQLVVAITNPVETDILLTFKNSLDDPDGNLDNWVSSTDPCNNEWAGVLCDPPGVFANNSLSYVRELRLLNLNLGGQLVEELGGLQALVYLDVMWNRISGSIPASIGNLTNLQLLLLNGNNFTGVLPPELGNLANLDRIQIDENHISGPVPSTFSQLTKVKHFHMNNNSLNGSIPEGLGVLPELVHVLLDNNQLSGTLPDDLAEAPNLLIIQLDNNLGFDGIPASYSKRKTLLKLSMRNCSLQGTVPDFNESTALAVLDLSNNNFTGSLPTSALPANMTAIDLADNQLTGPVPESVGILQLLQYLELSNNNLSGEIPANLGTGNSFDINSTEDAMSRIVLDFQNNSLVLSNDSNLATLQSRGIVELWLNGNPLACPPTGASNPLCLPTSVASFLGGSVTPPSTDHCSPCNSPYEVVPATDLANCRCAVPITVHYRLKSPGFTSFDLYDEQFRKYLSEGLLLSLSQVKITEYEYEPGPRIRIIFFLFPTGPNFNDTELDRLYNAFTQWRIPDSTVFGPYELIQFIFPGQSSGGSKGGLSAGALAGIIIVALAVTAICAAALMFFWLRRRGWDPRQRKRSLIRKNLIRVAGVKTFTFEELVKATDNFNEKNELGQGGYGKVYFGTLEDGQRVAVKRAEEGSLQGANEFENEILLLSRVHHRNLVSLVGYCQDEGEKDAHGEQMLVYEYISNGSLRHYLNKSSKLPMDVITRLRIALGSARGIHYLHTQADPPIFHRDIKASNILLDDKYNAKVADFGLSKLAPTEVDFEGANAGHVSTVVKGTPGYLDPEYYLTNKLTDKSDVYSFGVVLLELITGLPPIYQGKNIVREVNSAYLGGEMTRIVDSRMGSYPTETVEPFVRLALSCCHTDTNIRPSMAEVVHQLEEIWKGTPWSDVGSHIYVRDVEESQELPLRLQRGISTEMELLMSDGRSDVTGTSATSDLLSRTNINVQPR